MTYIGSDYKLRCYSLTTLAQEAVRLGIAAGTPFVADPQDGKRAKKQASLHFLLSKLKYCEEVFRGLMARRAAHARS